MAGFFWCFWASGCDSSWWEFEGRMLIGQRARHIALEDVCPRPVTVEQHHGENVLPVYLRSKFYEFGARRFDGGRYILFRLLMQVQCLQ